MGEPADRGHAAVELALGVGLLLVPVAMALLAFGPWLERRVWAEATAAEAARAAVLHLDLARGSAMVGSSAGDAGLSTDEVRVSWCAGGGCSFERGTSVTVTVDVWVPLVSTPWGDVGGLWATGSHSEPVDLYRSMG